MLVFCSLGYKMYLCVKLIRPYENSTVKKLIVSTDNY